MRIADSFLVRWLVIPYSPCPAARGFLDAAATQQRDGLDVRVAVLDDAASRKFFGVPMARRGIQPVWVHVVNRTSRPYRLQFVAIDPNHFSPLEAAAAQPLLGREAAAGFRPPGVAVSAAAGPAADQAAGRPLGEPEDGCVLPGTRVPHASDSARRRAGRVRLHQPVGRKQGGSRPAARSGRPQGFRVLAAGRRARYGPPAARVRCPASGRRPDRSGHARAAQYLASAPQATTNSRRPAVGRSRPTWSSSAIFPRVLGAFGARWDETEVISLATCWKTFRAFLIGAEYRYSPVSGLFLFGRSQDFALQRIRSSINERLHLRLWATPLQFRGQRVWLGQVSRDIGVRLTWRTWNLTTHRIDPDVDEARDYVVEDLMHIGRLEMAGYVDGVGPCDQSAPRRNLTGDPYYTDGKRAVVISVGIADRAQFRRPVVMA